MGALANLSLILTLLSISILSGHAQLCNRTDLLYTNCDYSTPVCECVPSNNVCRFCFEIETRHTFTRYFLTEEGVSGYGGRVVYFNDQGQLKELPPDVQIRCDMLSSNLCNSSIQPMLSHYLTVYRGTYLSLVPLIVTYCQRRFPPGGTLSWSKSDTGMNFMPIDQSDCIFFRLINIWFYATRWRIFFDNKCPKQSVSSLCSTMRVVPVGARWVSTEYVPEWAWGSYSTLCDVLHSIHPWSVHLMHTVPVDRGGLRAQSVVYIN